MPKRIVIFDTNIYISSIFWSGNPYLIVQKAIDQEFIVFISDEIIQELRKVLGRDFELTQQEVDDIIDSVILFTNLVEPARKVSVIKDDPTDDRILECALACNADYIVTQDKKHLLKLKEFEDIKIVSPEEFLKA